MTDRRVGVEPDEKISEERKARRESLDVSVYYSDERWKEYGQLTRR